MLIDGQIREEPPAQPVACNSTLAIQAPAASARLLYWRHLRGRIEVIGDLIRHIEIVDTRATTCPFKWNDTVSL